MVRLTLSFRSAGLGHDSRPPPIGPINEPEMRGPATFARFYYFKLCHRRDILLVTIGLDCSHAPSNSLNEQQAREHQISFLLSIGVKK
jgi:hypothetical protein